MTAALASRVRWLAARDGVAHARVGNAPRTLCGAMAIAERFAWPETSRCLRCWSLVTTPPTPIVRPMTAARGCVACDSPLVVDDVFLCGDCALDAVRELEQAEAHELARRLRARRGRPSRVTERPPLMSLKSGDSSFVTRGVGGDAYQIRALPRTPSAASHTHLEAQRFRSATRFLRPEGRQ